MFGIINVYKPAGYTSRDCVNIVSKNLKTRKVGHAGTLDPIAEGVLVVAVGQATRLIEYVQRQRKTYRGTFTLGLQSESYDTETEIKRLESAPIPSHSELAQACLGQVGSIDQVPPSYSAVRIDGKHAYELARSGIEFDMPTRTVDIYRCDLVSYSYPDFELKIECGSGTYVRSIGRDIAQSLQSSAVMTSLRREAIGVFNSDQAVAVDQFKVAEPQLSYLLPTRMAVSDLPLLEAAPDIVTDLLHGKLVQIDCDSAAEEFAIVDLDGNLRSIAKRYGNKFKASKNLTEG